MMVMHNDMHRPKERAKPGRRLTDRKCTLCDNPATVRYRRIWICRDCLNPEPTAEYLRSERERLTGSWGVVSTEDWEYH